MKRIVLAIELARETESALQPSLREQLVVEGEVESQ
jgi:hypothetical protein